MNSEIPDLPPQPLIVDNFQSQFKGSMAIIANPFVQEVDTRESLPMKCYHCDYKR